MRITSPTRIVRIYRTQPAGLNQRRRHELPALDARSASTPASSALWTAL